MKLSIDSKSLIEYLSNQLSFFYPDQIEVKVYLFKIMPNVLERMDYCFSHIHKKYYFNNGDTIFNHLNSDHYAMFLYFVANEAYKNNCINLAEKAFLLNKSLHGIDAFYSIVLPDIFLFVHPLGTILGNAKYSDFLVVYQNVTVGADIDCIYPQFGSGTILYSKTSVIGNCLVGENVTFASNSYIRKICVPSDSIVVGMYPDAVIKKNNKNNIEDFFNIKLNSVIKEG